MKHVFTRSGGKSRIANKIIELFPKDYENYTYISPFLGAGWVWLYKKQSEFSLLNDLDSVLYNAWMCVRDHPQELVELFNAQIKHEKIAYKYLDDLHMKPLQVPDLESAMKFILISKLLRGSILNPKRRTQRFAIMKLSLENIQEQIVYLSKKLSNSWIYCMDATLFINKVLNLKATRGHPLLFYLDIPYPDTANNYLDLSKGEQLQFSMESTRNACTKINDSGHLFFLSVNSIKETEALADEYQRHLLRTISKGNIGDEILITNYTGVMKNEKKPNRD